ncbi:MAG: peptide ligase PGM1-related protein [Paracoccaceae bacterium]|nr:peptide ligase PGM1-related protein [Paracoccaceae bacterium]
MTKTHHPNDADEFQRLQAGLADQYRRVFSDRTATRTVLVVPSLTLDQDVMAKITGITHYEERMLCLLLLLRLPHTHVIFVTSQPVPPAIIDYYLQLLPGVPREHALRRLTMLCCYDGSPQPLTTKILERPRLMKRLREAIPGSSTAHMTCFNVTDLERRLAVQLGLPIYGCDPDLSDLGSKSGSREVFREAGLRVAEGFENLSDIDDVANALTELKQRNPALRRAVVKLNEGFSGDGNAILNFDGAPNGQALGGWIRQRLPHLNFAAPAMNVDDYTAKVDTMGAIVEEFIEGKVKRTPSSQFRIDPLDNLEAISTHDQVVDDQSGQIFLGCRFPADEAYRLDIQDQGLKVGEVLARRGVLGRFGVDFISVKEADGWRHYAIEINLRKGGTTHPFLMLQFLTDGSYDPSTGGFTTRAGKPCHYYASDNLESPAYKGLMPEDLIDIAVEHGFHFDEANQEGVVFHLIGALSEFGKLGVTCVAGSAEAAERLYLETVRVLDKEGQR